MKEAPVLTSRGARCELHRQRNFLKIQSIHRRHSLPLAVPVNRYRPVLRNQPISSDFSQIPNRSQILTGFRLVVLPWPRPPAGFSAFFETPPIS